MKSKTNIMAWQRKLIEDYGLFVIRQNDRIAKGRETIYAFEVIDVYDQYTKDEILNLCVEHVQRAELPVSPHLQLFMTVLEFNQLSPHCYLYKCGHDYCD